ncbi:MAG: HAMP domain-containing sensor histidine kinase [Bacteroidota bacterium]
MSIKYKIVILFVALVTVIVSIGSVGIFFFSLKEREGTFKIRLKNRALSSARVYDELPGTNLSVLRGIDIASVASLYDKNISILAGDYTTVYQYADNVHESFIVSREILEKVEKAGSFFFDSKNKKAVAIKYAGKRQTFIVAVAAFDLDGAGYLHQLKIILLFSLALAAALAFVAGLFFAQSLVNPIKKITGEVNLISSNDLSQRIKVSDQGDELSKLSATFNHLLDGLQDSFAIQRRFISNASHELSTPLTSISSQIEVAIQKQRSPDEYREVLHSIYEDTRQLQQLTRSLLDIAKTGWKGSLDLTEVRLDEVLFKVVADIQRQNVEHKATLNFDVFPDDEKLLCIFGNANLLYIAFKNIIENGCKYSDNHTSEVIILVDKTNTIVKVANKGDVIAEADIEQIFQPFFRSDSVQNKPGFGLGLTLTKRILSLHNGSILVESEPALGTVFTIQIPNILSPK